MADVKFIHSQSGMSEVILKGNPKLQELQEAVFVRLLPIVQAQFFQQFGVEGNFEIAKFTTNRSNVAIQAADPTTRAVLQRNPGWLGKFTENLNIN
jgi:hypothetical protein